MFRLLALDDRADAAFGRCRILAYGGSPMPPAWIAELCARWPQLRPFDIYGLTEFTSLSHANRPEHVLARPGSVGRPVADVEQQLVGSDGTRVPPGEEGELWLAGPTRMLRYWRAPEATARALRGRWLRTGDVGTLDEDGFLTLRGRTSEVIMRGGEKIYAARVERALSHVPAVAEAAVVGVPDPILQERVMACILPLPGTAFDEAAARAALADELPDYALPERFVVVDELPRNAAGKLDRRAVRSFLAEAGA
jgi:acyl-CoA synthetase (AMP-forming)/AMP-acid ligase II